MKNKTLQFVELPPFDSFIVSGKSPWTFGIRELFSRPNNDLELIVSDKSQAGIFRKITNQEKQRGYIDAVLQGVGGTGAGLGVMATAGAAGVCPACYPIYASIVPVVGVGGASILIAPTGYLVLKRLGQKKVISNLDGRLDDSHIREFDYDPLLEIIDEQNLRMHIEEVDKIKKQPRRQRNRSALKVHKRGAYEGLIALQRRAAEMGDGSTEKIWATLSNAYGHAAKRFGRNTGITKPIILKQVHYKPVKRSTLALVGTGAALISIAVALKVTGTDPIGFLNLKTYQDETSQTEPDVIPEVIETSYHVDELLIEGMTCGNCVERVERSLTISPSVRDVTIYLAKGTGKVSYDANSLTHEQLLELMPWQHPATIQPHQER